MRNNYCQKHLRPLFFLGLLVVAISIFIYQNINSQTGEIRYVPIGDSYTIGKGVNIQENYPSMLTKHLQEKGLKIKLITNPAVSGWPTNSAIEKELPIFQSASPNFSTLLIGANDIFQGLDQDTFRKDLQTLMDKMLSTLKNKNLIVITIPDFTATPSGQKLTGMGAISKNIIDFNKIIKEEANTRGLVVVDVFDLSKEMQSNPQLVSGDGLHPSAKEYAKWEELIFPQTVKILQLPNLGVSKN